MTRSKLEFGSGDMLRSDSDYGLPPSVFTSPTIAGNNAIGQTLTLTSGEYGNVDSTAIQWWADGEPINGATNGTYVVTLGTVNNTFECRETLTNASGTALAVSNLIE